MFYLDNVTRLDGAVGFVIAQHQELPAIFCVKWPDQGDPEWASPDLIIDWEIGSGIARQELHDAIERVNWEMVQQAWRETEYDPLQYIH